MGISNQGIKKPEYNVSTTTGVIPAAVPGTGTFTVSTLRVIGSGAAFTTEVKNGDYLYSTTLNEVRRVKHVMNPDLILLSVAFSGAVPSDNVNIIRKQDISNFLQIGFANTGLTDATVDEDVLPSLGSVNFGDPGGIGPITFDGTGTTLGISRKLRG